MPASSPCHIRGILPEAFQEDEEVRIPEELVTLEVGRYLHSSWTPDSSSVTYLMGGYTSNRTTTLITPDGSQEQGFQLKYET